MKHFLHILVLTFVLVSPLRVLADTVTFDFSTDQGLSALGIEKPDKGKGTDLKDKAYTIGDVTMTCTNGTAPTRIWNSKGTTELRFYKEGGSITFTVPTGQQVTNVVFNGTLECKCTIGALNGLEWTDNGTPTNTVTFTAKKNKQYPNNQNHLFKYETSKTDCQGK